ncbi:MAG: cobalamin-binding protein [Acidobacteria bacterium]|nr:cobalamin-binding protein [Acidobacteriota bacterium]MBI3425097.1 cobalamin-binding protein [Acidobacteriota bacterium]
MFSIIQHCQQWLVCVAVLLSCASCRPAPSVSQAGRHVFTDELQRQVAVIENPQRLISLAPNVTEMLFALGLGDRVVAVTSYCDFPPAAKAKEKIGDTLQPNLERIIALKPDLVIASTASQVERLTRQLDQLNIPLYVTNPRSVRDVAVAVRHLGEVTGAQTAAQTLADQLAARIQAVEARNADLPKPRVLFVLQLAPLITVGRDTFINDLITRAGGVSISGEESADYPQFSREAVIARAPEFIVAPEMHGDGAIGERELSVAFATTPAVRNQRIVRISPDLTSRPGPRLIDGLEQLANALHPPAAVAPKTP